MLHRSDRNDAFALPVDTMGSSMKEATQVAARIILRIELTPAARARLDQCLKKSGMTQLSMLSR
jgi:hypothetical protein